MVDENRNNIEDNSFTNDYTRTEGHKVERPHHPYTEETAAEVAPAINQDRSEIRTDDTNVESGGTALGYSALILSILSLFVFPILFGAVGIIMGFMARNRGAGSLGAWAIGIGVVSIIISLFFAPLGNFNFR